MAISCSVYAVCTLNYNIAGVAMLTLLLVMFNYHKFIKLACYVWHRKSWVLSYILCKKSNITHKKMLTINTFVMLRDNLFSNYYHCQPCGQWSWWY